MKTIKRILYIIGGLIITFVILVQIDKSIPDEAVNENVISIDNNNAVTENVETNRPAPTPSLSFNQVGYYKGSDNHRVFTFNVSGNFSRTSIINHGNRQANTSGRNTYVFYYNRNAPNPTMSRSLDQALSIAYSQDCIYIYHKSNLLNGGFSATDLTNKNCKE